MNHAALPLPLRRHHVDLPTGVLTLSVAAGPDISDLCAFAARANPRRGFLVVSKVLGRHLPARPAAMRGAMDALAASLPGDLPQPVVFMGMAETATALGQGVFAAFQARHPATACCYLQSARQRVGHSAIVARFEEGHSHATSHLVQVREEALLAHVGAARSLVIIDDECSTGNTFVAAAQAMAAAMPALERVHTCCLTDWSAGDYLADMPGPAHAWAPAQAHALLSGVMAWQAGNALAAPPLPPGSNGPGQAPATGMRSRSGLRRPEAARRAGIAARPGERVLVLGDGEHSYEALRIAEEIEAQGGIAAVQSITRTPALLGQAMATRATFTDAYGSGAPMFLYNMLAHDPDRIVIAAEIVGDQVARARQALAEMGRAVPVELVCCTYGDEGQSAC